MEILCEQGYSNMSRTQYYETQIHPNTFLTINKFYVGGRRQVYEQQINHVKA